MLKEFFVDQNITIPFKLFGKTHCFLMLFVLVGLFIVYFNRKRINHFLERLKRKIVVIFALILLFNMITYFGSILAKEKWYPYLYFLAFLGPIPAIIFLMCRVFGNLLIFIYILLVIIC